jgi:hypothetical protein
MRLRYGMTLPGTRSALAFDQSCIAWRTLLQSIAG